ncbi:MAG: peptidase domain-containing ABC transporter [Bacteroidota bacterium]
MVLFKKTEEPHKFRFYHQHDQIDCGPACLRMIAGFYGKQYSLSHLRDIMYLGNEGVSLLSISDAAEKIGFRTLKAKLPLETLINDCPLPCILHWQQDHFVVLYKITRSRFAFWKKKDDLVFVVADPGHDMVRLDKKAFLKNWVSTSEGKGIGLFLEPSPEFYKQKSVSKKRLGFSFLLPYIKPYKKYIFQILLGMILGSLIALAFPFLTQALVDYGVELKDYNVIYLILLSQILLFFGNTAIDFIRNWLMLHMNTRVSVSLISDFLIKLMNLPIRFFDTKLVGDITQRIKDHSRIEIFLTGAALASLFSAVNILIFSIVLAIYDWLILFVFLSLSFFSILWIQIFMGKRKNIDYKRFLAQKENQDSLVELITGMQEIKLFGGEKTKRWSWEHLQIKLFKVKVQSLALEQYQRSGFIFITQIKNIIISFLAAKATVEGSMTLGMMLSISYIIGQLNSPIEQLVVFFKAAQDAGISLDRLQEIHNKENEDEELAAPEGAPYLRPDFRFNQDIHIRNLAFQYEGPRSPFVLDDISLTIPHGKTTAIVGESGSGKTTLLKLLLKFYEPVEGSIMIGDTDLSHIPASVWRKQCGAVMQEGFIFSDTITRNIIVDGGEIDEERLLKSVETANIQDFIETLPTSYTSKIGNLGLGLSTGQKQRILIARAVYKNPTVLLFDEATSALDANNEKVIVENLKDFFVNKTVLVIAHRLSTVKDADQIVVMQYGQIVETGKHEELVAQKGYYYELIKNQLELGG